jgi:hypothetical protein
MLTSKLWARRLILAIQQLWPYLALVMLPGGSFIALATWVYRHRPTAPGRS